MTDEVTVWLARARRDLEAARLLAGGGFTDQAISRAYYAAFYAAEACLRSLGERRKKHSALVSAFVRMVVKEHGFAAEAAALLSTLFDERIEADYAIGGGPPSTADVAIAEAERFISEAERWLAEHR